MNPEKIKILYIGGFGRSGSTLLQRVLGQIDGFFAVGELWNLWQSSFTENELCGCGQPFRECDFWNGVVQEAYGGFQNVDLEEINVLRDSVYNNLNLPRLTFRFLQSPHYHKRVDTYKQVLNRLYQGIQKVSGCRVIVDSSKGPRHAYLLSQIPNLELYIVHIVRDSRAVAYSWQKKLVRPDVPWKTVYMDRPGPVKSSFYWNMVNISFQVFKRAHANYLMVPYEDLVLRPQFWFPRMIDFVHESGVRIPFMDNGKSVHLGVDHTVAGNPNRFRQGDIELRLDTEWQRKMEKSQKALVTALTWPLLYSYGYLGGNHSYRQTQEAAR
jgi:hypothetical protein